MHIDYTLGPRGLAKLRQDLDNAGVAYTYQPPMEQRSGGGDVVVTGVLIISGFVGGFLNKAGGDAYDATKRVVKKWHDKPLLGQRVDLHD